MYSVYLQMNNVFITGATGLIGGAVLHDLLETPSMYKYEITAQIRTQNKADNKQNKTLLVHTSGTSILQYDLSSTNGPPTKCYGNSSNLDEIVKLPATQPHKPVDDVVLRIQAQSPELVRTAIICSSTIYGVSKGYDKINSVQIPWLVKSTIKAGQPVTVYSGDYNWLHVHVDDLAIIYHKITKSLLDGSSNAPSGDKGYYFAQAGNLPNWRQVAVYIVEQLVDKGLIFNKTIKELEPASLIDINEGFEFAPYFWGINSVCKAENAFKLSWQPAHISDEEFYKDIDQDIDYILSQK
ncbi:hypothetical protein NADFUDRAFT_74476 [Nadsonia fulvescens var. elongata DSM 6958]|uniref:NAD(P)-binding protein n=1 Tax=Nadsonia fulvescens var. elongata DSM 6958 TaxID=857566 RepID=A0A1E3PHS2_9ASCO|nr:hypothetical protein NADFUDRAFT_74476 [Nadsonia fulvescens var. elongata DSM 6958]